MTRLTALDHDRAAAGLTYVYPVLSRRAGGVSVGINLNPNNACNWHCAYCQVPGLTRGKAPRIDVPMLVGELHGFLDGLVNGDLLRQLAPEGMREIRDIAFSGNGEPTSAREFPQIVDETVRLWRDFGLDARGVALRLITNGSLMGQAGVQRAIAHFGAAGGEVWFKVDAGTPEAIERINGVRLAPETIARNLAISCGLCRTWVQTCMFRWDGAAPGPEELAAYLAVLESAGLQGIEGVHLYGIARQSMQPEAVHLGPLEGEALESIAVEIRKKGLTVRVSP